MSFTPTAAEYAPQSALIQGRRHSGESGQPRSGATDAQKRGEKLFFRPFPHDPGRSCSSCHQPAEAFVDHRQHDVGSGGLFKTPTLLNAKFNGPYFHDGRYGDYEQVVEHFDRVYSLHLSKREQSDLVAYLQAVGDGERAVVADDMATRVKEIADFGSALDTALPQHDTVAAELVLDTLDRELRELIEKFPERKDTTVSGGLQERARARSALKELVLALREVALPSRLIAGPPGPTDATAPSGETGTASAFRLAHRGPCSVQTRAFVTH